MFVIRIVFKSVYSDGDFDLPPNYQLDEMISTGLVQLHFSLEDVAKTLQDLDGSKGPGPDGISPSVLKSCCESLATPIWMLFEQSMSTGVFPAAWKLSHIVPIFKSGTKDDVANYRGISILSAISKMFEALVNEVVKSHVLKAIVPQQHGFFPQRSCVTNLAHLTTDIAGFMESGCQVAIVYLQTSKRHSIESRRM